MPLCLRPQRRKKQKKIISKEGKNHEEKQRRTDPGADGYRNSTFDLYISSGLGPTGTGAAKNIHTGLDLAGGVSITYEASEKNPSAEDMSDTIYKLQERVEQYSTESQVYQEGNNRIVVEIPGVTDANKILEELGKPGSLYFIAQKDADGNENYTLNTQTGEYELTKSVEELQEDGSIVLTGTDVSDAKAMVDRTSWGIITRM